jgi:bifunctional UDP-N-acetylglucosamine pyrophosphorylase/glucosamine-1-phosphate N-acetyltransferase
MAAGLGTRMRSSRPKHLHPLLGRRVLDWVLAAAAPLGAAPVVVVASEESREDLEASLPDGVTVAVQESPRGTGDAVAAARSALAGFDGDVLVLSGDAVLATPEALGELVSEHRREGAAVTVLSFEPDDPGAYGRVLRDGEDRLRGIVEARDASPEELAVREVNSSIYVFAADALWDALGRLEPHNVQGELYLTDAVQHVADAGGRAGVVKAGDPSVGEGVNTRVDLAAAAAILRDRILRDHMLAGVTVVDPSTTWVEPDVVLEPDAVIQPFTILRGGTVVRGRAEVGPHVVAVDAEIGPDALVGPFCYLRPGTVLEAGAKAGAFVEIKNSHIGEGTKVPHLSYVGDADIGPGTNIAAGNITVNFPHQPGRPKGRTTIGKDVRTGVHNAFVAPVEIGDNAWVAAGSVITEDVPPGALAIARTRQVNKEGYADAVRQRGD